MTEKRKTSQGYIIRILQHFATKLRNITNFVMLYPDLFRSKFHSKGERSIVIPGSFGFNATYKHVNDMIFSVLVLCTARLHWYRRN
jgi:hypothetical protein